MSNTASLRAVDATPQRVATPGVSMAFNVLRLGFTVAPILAGTDKFLDFMTNWDKYLAPIVPRTLGVTAHTFMMIVGAIEIVAGLLVAWKPRLGGFVVAAWLAGIILNLLLNPDHYWDVALRDLGLLLGALALGLIAGDLERPNARRTDHA
ncbi:hypothetical protein EON82_16375 [bacterium]|nr:MAG: hypothetical protein EON82_16375 [bacterium]